MRQRAVIGLGVSQCLNWGVLYYAFTVLVLPVSKELSVGPWTVTGAFSLALLMSALLAPLIGTWIDRGAGPLLMEAGGWTGAALLAAWALVPGVPMLFAAWLGLGACMAATLYEPAFAIVGRAMPDPAARLRALALITVFGGAASTVFLPLTDGLVRSVGWRPAVGSLSAILAASTALTRVVVFAEIRPGAAIAAHSAILAPPGGVGPVFWWTLVTFAFASFASAGLTANLVPALDERHVSPSAAALLGSMFGLMQLPGRLLLSTGGAAGSPMRLIFTSLLLQAGGLLAFWVAPSVVVTAGGLVIFAGGAGLATLARPHFMQTHFGTQASARLGGRVARWQQVARSAGPITAAGLGALVGFGPTVGLLGASFALLAVGAYRLNGGDRVSRSRPEAGRRAAFPRAAPRIPPAA
jgi:MFS family permease